MYYLGGDEHIEVFDQYVYDNYPQESVGLAGLGLRISEDKKITKSPKGLSSLKNFSTQLPSTGNFLKSQTKSKFLSNHVSSSLEKRKFVQDEFKIQTAYNKMRLK